MQIIQKCHHDKINFNKCPLWLTKQFKKYSTNKTATGTIVHVKKE